MIVYLDQNKWIELAQIVNGVEKSDKSKQLLEEFNAAIAHSYIFPLSAIHIIEFSRITDVGKRKRLGEVMWKYSQGKTTAPIKELICRELEIAFQVKGFAVTPRPLSYIGLGIPFSFGEELKHPVESIFGDEIDKAMLCGNEVLNIDPVHYKSIKHRRNFSNHLNSLHKRKHEIEKSMHDNWLYALSMKDIIEPLHDVMNAHRIPEDVFEGWSEMDLRGFVECMPTRKIDIHLHRQVLRNPQYKSKLSDLEDWAGLGSAMCYADIVVCEKHFADMVFRDGFRPKARVETSIYDVFHSLI